MRCIKSTEVPPVAVGEHAFCRALIRKSHETSGKTTALHALTGNLVVCELMPQVLTLQVVTGPVVRGAGARPSASSR